MMKFIFYRLIYKSVFDAILSNDDSSYVQNGQSVVYQLQSKITAGESTAPTANSNHPPSPSKEMRFSTLTALILTVLFACCLQDASPARLQRRQSDASSEIVPVDSTCVDNVWSSAIYDLTGFPALDNFMRVLSALVIYRASGFPEALPPPTQRSHSTTSVSTRSSTSLRATCAGGSWCSARMQQVHPTGPTEPLCGPRHLS